MAIREKPNGFSYQEISRITSLSVSNVGFLIHTDLKTIRHQLNAICVHPRSSAVSSEDFR